MEKASLINDIIRSRRSIFPPVYNGRKIDREIIEQILENANWAPTHANTEPWRFKVLLGGALERLSKYLGEWYVTNTPADKFSDKKHEKMQQNPLRSACAIAIVMQRDAQARVPEWEEMAAVSAAVQNMQLTCHAYGIGCFWSSPRAALEADSFLGLTEGEKCLGFLYMGYSDAPHPEGKRQPVADKVVWLED